MWIQGLYTVAVRFGVLLKLWACVLKPDLLAKEFGPGGNDPHGYTVFMELEDGWDVVAKIITAGGGTVKSTEYSPSDWDLE